MECNNKNKRLHKNVRYLIGKYYNIRELVCMCKDYNDGVFVDIGNYSFDEEFNIGAWLNDCNNECYFKAYCDEINKTNNNNKNKRLN